MSCNSFSAVVKVITDVETKQFNSNTLAKCRAVQKFSYKEDSDMYLGLNFWGSKAAPIEKNLKKFDQLFVRGNLSVKTIGEKVYLDLNVDDFHWINFQKNGEQVEKSQAPKKGKEVESVAVEVEAEIPF